MQKPPQLPSISWRPLVAGDTPALRELDAACKQADGDEWVSRLVEDTVSASITPDATQCAWLDRQIAAAGWIIPGQAAEQEQSFVLGGKVHPTCRRRGLRTSLLVWAEQEAVRQAGPRRSIRLVIRSESLTPDAHAIYTRAGFTQLFVEQMMVRSLAEDVPAVHLADTLALLPWNPQTAHGYYRAYAASFRDRPGFSDPPEAEWLAAYADDAEFLPELSLLAVCDAEPVGFVACEALACEASALQAKTSQAHEKMGWISQMGVVPAWRGQGLGGALLAETLRRFRLAGFSLAGLHVNLNNPGAIRVYARLGFHPRLQRARYVKSLAADLLSQ